jgi:integrase
MAKGRMSGVYVTGRGKRRTTFRVEVLDARGDREYLGTFESEDEAYTEGARARRRILRGSKQSLASTRITVNELICDHYLPSVKGLWTSGNTYRTAASHLGDGTGVPRGRGRKAEQAATFAIRTVFGHQRLNDVLPAHVLSWQTQMVESGYGHGSILAKKGYLRAAMQFAAVNGWLENGNPVLAVPHPRRPPRVEGGAHKQDDGTIIPTEWATIRDCLYGEGTLLLLDLKLDAGLRFGEVTGLRPMDLIDADDKDVQHAWLRQNVVWPGTRLAAEYLGRPGFVTREGVRWVIQAPKGKRYRKVSVRRELYLRLLAYIDTHQITPEALIFDYGRLRAEHSEARSERPASFPFGRYTNATTGRSAEHGTPTAYQYGCRCPGCKNANTEYAFWRARMRGRRSAQPWREPGFLASRGSAIDPVEHQWFERSVWLPAVRNAQLSWRPTPHQLRHAMVSWSLEGGAPLVRVQANAGHANVATTQGYQHRLDSRVDTTKLDAMEKMYNQMSGTPVQKAEQLAAHSGMDVVFMAFLGTLPEQEKTAIMLELMTQRQAQPKPDLRLV